MENIEDKHRNYERDRSRLNGVDKLLDATLPNSSAEFYDLVRQTFGKEFSLGNIERTDVLSFVKGSQLAHMLILHGQNVLARTVMDSMITEMKTSMSIDGGFVSALMRDTVDYNQNQYIHEYNHENEKRGFFGRRKPPSQPQS